MWCVCNPQDIGQETATPEAVLRKKIKDILFLPIRGALLGSLTPNRKRHLPHSVGTIMMNRTENSLAELRSEGQGRSAPWQLLAGRTVGRDARPSYSQPVKTLSFESMGKRVLNTRQPACADALGSDNQEYTGTSPWKARLVLSASLHFPDGRSRRLRPDTTSPALASMVHPYLRLENALQEPPEEIILSRSF